MSRLLTLTLNKSTIKGVELIICGYGDNARKSRVYAIYMNGSVELISHHSSKDIQPGCEIVVPSKKQKRQMSTAEMMSMGTSAASIATMIITVAKILK